MSIIKMQVFLTYTLRDGILSPKILSSIAETLSPIATVYVDLLHNSSTDPQTYVLQQLVKSDLVLACRTPGFSQSPWALLELKTASANLIPIVDFTIDHTIEANPMDNAIIAKLETHVWDYIKKYNCCLSSDSN